MLDELRSGVIDRVPESALDCVPANIRDEIPDELIEFATTNPELSLAVVIVAVLATLLFLYKLAKRAFMVALFAGVIAAAAWWWWVADPNIF